MGEEEARSNHGLGYVDALDGPLSDGGSIPPASIPEPLVIPAVLFLGDRTVRFGHHVSVIGFFSDVKNTSSSPDECTGVGSAFSAAIAWGRRGIDRFEPAALGSFSSPLVAAT